MRNFTNALLLAAAALASVSTSAIAQVTNDIDVIESRERSREMRQERIESAREQRQQQVEVQQAAPQQERPVFQPRAERQSNVEVRQDRGDFDRRANREQNNVEVRRDGGFFNRRNDQRQGNVEVRRDDRRFDNRRGGVVTGASPQPDVVATPQNNNRNDGRFDGRRFEERNGQRFGRNEEYRSDRDDRRRFDRDDFKRRGEIARDGNWYRDGSGKWQRRDGRNYGNRDNRDYSYNGDRKDFRWNRDWRRDSRYDWKSYRFSNRNFFRQSRYYDPFGSRYGYQRFSIGIRLGSSYYNDRYWISDPFAYRLPYADGPYRWVRYYDDVLLVDLRNGAVVDVIYDFFW
jgi:hypothetical protein